MKNEGLCYSLISIGWITIFLGVVGAVILMVQFSKSGLFGSGGELSVTEVSLIFGVLLYHIVFGTISLGVGKILELSTSSSTGTSSLSASSQTKCTHIGETGNYCTQCGETLITEPQEECTHKGQTGNFCTQCGIKILSE